MRRGIDAAEPQLEPDRRRATLKVYGTMSGRRSTTDMRACETDGLVETAPSYNSLFRTVERADLMPLFRSLVEESAKPLKAIEKTFAVDGTGFATQTYVRWFDYKYGEEKRARRWVKAHAMVGTITNVITSVEATKSNVNDSPMFKPLVEKTAANGFTVAEVSARDGGTSSFHPRAVACDAGTSSFHPRAVACDAGTSSSDRCPVAFDAGTSSSDQRPSHAMQARLRYPHAQSPEMEARLRPTHARSHATEASLRPTHARSHSMEARLHPTHA